HSEKAASGPVTPACPTSATTTQMRTTRGPGAIWRVTALAPLIVLAVVVLASIWRRGAVHPNDTAAIHSGDRATLRYPYGLAFGGKETLDPTSPTRFMEAISILYDRLVVLNPAGEPRPGLAVSWASNSDATVWTFKLREG